MATTTTSRKPTRRQLAYLKALADRTGQTFTYPQTSQQASAEINRLKNAKPSSPTERYIERKLIADQIASGPIDSARVREDEIAGRGSSATWVHNREQAPPALPDPGPTATRERAAPVVGKRTELARYTLSDGNERVLYGQRIDGSVRFLPGNLVVLVGSLGPSEDSTCRSRTTMRAEGCTKALQRKRPNDASEPRCPVDRQQEGWS
jgi:hypothetical protein